VAAQVYALRQKHDKTQEQLAQETGMSQARISVLENPNYRKFNVGTLQRIAAAFDVALIVRFVSFGELLDWTVTGSQNTLAPRSFEDEFSEAEAPSPVATRDKVAKLLDWSVAKISRQQRPPTKQNPYQASLFDYTRRTGSGLTGSSITPAPAAGTTVDIIQQLQSQTAHREIYNSLEHEQEAAGRTKQIAVPQSGVSR
jgi:transcriptional regulator with XRE-family HTH domain